MGFVAVRDLQRHARRYLVSVVAVALVFALALILTGLSAYFDKEIDSTLDAGGGDWYVAPVESSGPLFGSGVLDQNQVDQLLTEEPDASPILFRPLIADDAARTGVNVFGVRFGQVGTPPLVEGRIPSGDREVVADRRLPVGLGEQFVMAGNQYTVVGRTAGLTLNGGQPNVYTDLAGMQRDMYGGLPIFTVVVGTGNQPDRLPSGTHVLTRADAVTDLRGPVRDVSESIVLIMVMLWGTAAVIIGSVIYLSVIERTKDFAVLKALGVTSRGVAVTLAIQAAVIVLVASATAVTVAFVVRSSFPVPVHLTASSAFMAVGVSVVVAATASLFGVKRAVTVDPALAFS